MDFGNMAWSKAGREERQHTEEVGSTVTGVGRESGITGCSSKGMGSTRLGYSTGLSSRQGRNSFAGYSVTEEQ